MTTETRSRYVFPNATEEYPFGYLRPTLVNAYRDCPRCAELEWVRKVPKPESIHFAIGGAVHKVAESIGRAILDDASLGIKIKEDGKLDLTPLEDIAADEFDRRLHENLDEESGVEYVEVDLAKFSDLGAAKDEAVRLVPLLLETLPTLFRDRGLLATEMSLRDLYTEDVLNEVWPFPMNGTLDAVYGADEVLKGMSDFKTAASRGGPDENNAIQFALYTLPAHHLGVDPWVACDKIIKTKTPYMETYWANGNGIVLPEQYAVVKEIVLDVADRISAGDFPIGHGWHGSHTYSHNFPAFSLAVSGFSE